MSEGLLSEKFIKPNGHCRCCGWLAEKIGHAKSCQVPEVALLEVKANHFDNIIFLIKVDNFDEIIMNTIYEYCEENDIDIKAEQDRKQG